MRVIFRTDASTLIGSGHVMRCLTLAEMLRLGGAEIGFITRPHEGDLNSLIKHRGFKLYELATEGQEHPECEQGGYAAWLGTTQESDAAKTASTLKDKQLDWLIIDHYALDEEWEKQLRPYVENIMVIDDLANRRHDCDLLLDQNYARGNGGRYLGLVPTSCTKLLGPRYALLRSEFAKARRNLRSRNGLVSRLLIFFGGSDPENMTGQALRTLSTPDFSQLDVDVVVGSANPHFQEIKHLAKNHPRTRLLPQVENMAELMSIADLGLGAGGATTWERLCLGLPSLVVTIAENQELFTRALHEDGLLRWLGSSREINEGKMADAIRGALGQTERNREWSSRGMELVDGHGTRRVASLLLAGAEAEELVAREAVGRDCALL